MVLVSFIESYGMRVLIFSVIVWFATFSVDGDLAGMHRVPTAEATAEHFEHHFRGGERQRLS